MSTPVSGPGRSRGPALTRLLRALALLAGWAVIAVPVAGLTFLNSARDTTLAGHEATVRPSLDGHATFDLGPFLPSFRYPSGATLGARIDFGRTEVDSYEALLKRYAFIASQPEGTVAKLRDTLEEMAVDAALSGAVAGLAGPGLWLLLGAARRREIVRAAGRPRVALASVLVLFAAGMVVVRPWDRGDGGLDATTWQPIAAAVPDVPVPRQARPLQVDGDLLTNGTKRLVQSAFASYRTSLTFYSAAALRVPELAERLHRPAPGETVAVLVSDRHDNIGMDRVARAVADAGGASFLLDAGDDTSTGSSWEAFSLESLDQAFSDYSHRYQVSGNHDQGDYIATQAARLGFTPLLGDVVRAPDGIRLLGDSDPRSSGLGNWRDATAVPFEEQAEALADTACAADRAGERVSTLLVHDANSGAPALRRGCVDLVLAGHLHVLVGPDRVESEDGRVGYSFTTASTGGAAYAIAIGTKPRRDAVTSLVTYAEGRPVGIQWVSLSPLGDLTVGRYHRLRPGDGTSTRPSVEARGR